MTDFKKTPSAIHSRNNIVVPIEPERSNITDTCFHSCKSVGGGSSDLV